MSKYTNAIDSGDMLDLIVKLLNQGQAPDVVFLDIFRNFEHRNPTVAQKQYLADLIAQIFHMNVQATGTIPKFNEVAS